MATNSTEKKVYGILAEFAGPAELMKAAEAVRDAGFKQFDCHSPFPIHGMDKAMGLKKSPLGYFVAIAGFTGLLVALALQWWAASVAYPLIISGKPLFSHQAFVPITFEVTILFSAITAVLGMFALNKLPTLWHYLFFSNKFKKASDNGFFVSLDAGDPKFDPTQNKKLLQSVGCIDFEIITEEAR